MNIKRVPILVVIIFMMLSGAVSAKRYWPAQPLVNWDLSLNNGVAYITSTEFASHCNYSRGQINMDGTEFNKAQYAYALSAKARGKKLTYVVDDTETTCVITALKEIN